MQTAITAFGNTHFVISNNPDGDVMAATSPLATDRPMPIAISVEEAVRLSGLSRATLHRLMETGRLAYAKPTRNRRLILTASLLDLLRAVEPVRKAGTSTSRASGDRRPMR